MFAEIGYLEDEFSSKVTAASNAMIRPGQRPYLFVDAERLDGYDPAIRTDATDWLNKNKDYITVQHMLVRSRLTKMGLTLASLALGGKILVGHSDRKGFDDALRDAIIKTRTRGPASISP